MTVYISILRGINVSGKRIIKMEALRELMSELKFTTVQTYIQSGNIIFQTVTSRASVSTSVTNVLSKKIAVAIEKQFGFEVPVITMTLEDLKQSVESNPFLKDKNKDVSFLHITFLAEAPQDILLKTINGNNYLPDEIQLINKTMYLYCPNGYGKTKLHNAFLENKLKVTATTRNWKTCNELIQIATKINA